MLFKLLWVFVLFWIAVRVVRAAGNIMQILRGRAEALETGPTEPLRQARSPQGEPVSSRPAADIEDAKFRDLG